MGSMSRARSGVPWERGGPRLAPPAGAVASMRRLGCPPLWFDPGNRTVLSVQKPWPDGCVSTEAGGPRPTRGALAPLVALATCLAADVVPRRPSRRRRPHPAGCFHPRLPASARPVGTAMAGASSMAGQTRRLHLPDPPQTSLPSVGAARRGYRSGPRGVPQARLHRLTTRRHPAAQPRRAPAGSPEAGHVSEITSIL